LPRVTQPVVWQFVISKIVRWVGSIAIGAPNSAMAQSNFAKYAALERAEADKAARAGAAPAPNDHKSGSAESKGASSWLEL